MKRARGKGQNPRCEDKGRKSEHPTKRGNLERPTKEPTLTFRGSEREGEEGTGKERGGGSGLRHFRKSGRSSASRPKVVQEGRG